MLVTITDVPICYSIKKNTSKFIVVERIYAKLTIKPLDVGFPIT